MRWLSGYNVGQEHDLTTLPSPSVQACGIGGSGHGQYTIIIEEKENMKEPMQGKVLKPPYRVPLMAEIALAERTRLKVATTFAGGGGSSTGYKLARFQVVWANEFVPSAQETYESNHPGTILDRRDIKLVQASEILAATGLRIGELDLFDGSPPCQAFSTAGKREKGWGEVKKYEGGAEQLNERLFFEYIRLVKGLQPIVFVAENVKGLTIGAAKELMMGDAQKGMFGGMEFDGKPDENGDRKRIKLPKDEDTILHALMDAGHPDFGGGYVVETMVLNAANLGVPQTRNRVIFIGVRKDVVAKHGVRPCFPKSLPYVYTVRDALPELFGLAPVRVVEGNEKFEPVFGDGHRPSPTLSPGHRSYPELSVEQRQVIASELEKAKQEGAHVVTVRTDPATGDSLELDKSRQKVCDGTQEYGSAGEAAEPDAPAPTVLTPSNSVVCKTERRKFTIAELRRICAFPDDYVLAGSYAQQWARLGNSVPPVMMQRIAEAIRDGIFAKLGDLGWHQPPKAEPKPEAAAAVAPRKGKGKGKAAADQPDAAAAAVAQPEPAPAPRPEPVKPKGAIRSSDVKAMDDKWANWKPVGM